ncbi:MAG: ABC transporter permease [Anaerotruncus massiliensis (ex Togo et al. 2019)]
MLIVVCVVMGFLNRNFFSMANIISMLTLYSYYIIGAIGLVFVFLSGNSGIDLSIGYVTGFSAVVSTKTMSLLSDANPDMNPWLIIVLGLLVSCTIGALFGLLNGIAVAKFHIAPFIITLASQLLAMGLCYVFTNGYTVSGGPRELSRLSTLTGIHIGKTIIPMAAIIPIVIFILMAVVLEQDHVPAGRSS